MAAIGRMAASIAHEVNNPLEAILNLGYLLDRNPSLDDEARGYARLLVSEVLRVSEITRQTLSFYRDTSTLAEVDVPAHPGECLEPAAAPDGAEVHSFVHRGSRNAPPSGPAPASFARYLPIFCSTPSMRFRAAARFGSASHRIHGNSVCVTIADNGPGIPENVRGKIFRPFFTTKISKGTGLGLWISQGIVHKYGGSIRMRTSSAPRRTTGTVFRVCLPTSRAELSRPAGSPLAPAPPLLQRESASTARTPHRYPVPAACA